jgi:hypothetical protein
MASMQPQPSFFTTNVENNRIILDKVVLNNVRVLRRYGVP